MQAYTSPRRFLGGSVWIYWCLGVVVAAGIILSGFFYNRHHISILADGKETSTIIRGGTVADAIKKARITLGPKDIVDPSMQTGLTDDLKIRITRLIKITVVADGNTEDHWVPLSTVGQALKQLNIPVNTGDQIVPAPEKRLTSGDMVEVIRFSEKYVNQSLTLAFKTERRDDNSMEHGSMRIVRQVREGLKQKTIKITLKNGKEIKRETVSEKTVREPVNKIIAVGTVRTKVVSRGGTLRFSRVITMSSSAYSHTGHNTASGIYPYRGAVAVDPKVIPLGTRLYVEGYGYAKALDIGSAIKGSRIDLFFDTEKEARRWGRRSVKVYILQ